MLQVGNGSRQVWQFATGNGEVSLNTQARLPLADPLPARLVTKDWRALWRKKLNIAWLPAEQVFLRVADLPNCDPAELRSMVELQLEKISPLPVNQIVWSFETIPGSSADLQTVIVIIVERSLVEDFLGKLEGDGYLADRIELELLHQLLATPVAGDDVWVFVSPAESKTVCLVAWWCAGRLKNLNVLNVPAGEAGAAAMNDQLTKIAWAGELEGWLTAAPGWHLAADDATAAVWEPALREWAGRGIELHPLRSPHELAGLSARRAARSETQVNLLPSEFAARYQQQFIDRLWMRGLAGLILVYLAGVVVYFAALEVLKIQKSKVEKQVTALSGAYTNALQLKARIDVLQQQIGLRYAALDCWKITSEKLPAELTLTSFTFARGNKLTLRGNAPA
ncbi:MAG TPA: hypothetical protein VJW76_04130, partial [Verrucomicrobiae bacterium]|nr:hypothetical protein [Verrucomicrobiae bacterium]